jgi:DNA-binding NarL/FixJ family response regulator
MPYKMPITVVLADDSKIMLAAMRQLLAQESSIKILGEASSFAATIQLIGDLKPEVLILDLHLPEKRNFPPGLVKSQLTTVPHTLAVSFSNDTEAKTLAQSYGAEALLDKMKLYNEMIPSILTRH